MNKEKGKKKYSILNFPTKDDPKSWKSFSCIFLFYFHLKGEMRKFCRDANNKGKEGGKEKTKEKPHQTECFYVYLTHLQKQKTYKTQIFFFTSAKGGSG